MKPLVKKVSRQRRWQLRKIAQGLCQTCGDAPIIVNSLCAEHALQGREYLRTKRRELGVLCMPKRGRKTKYPDALLLAIAKGDA